MPIMENSPCFFTSRPFWYVAVVSLAPTWSAEHLVNKNGVKLHVFYSACIAAFCLTAGSFLKVEPRPHERTSEDNWRFFSGWMAVRRPTNNVEELKEIQLQQGQFPIGTIHSLYTSRLMKSSTPLLRLCDPYPVPIAGEFSLQLY